MHMELHLQFGMVMSVWNKLEVEVDLYLQL